MNIYLVCNAGMSTSIVVRKMQEAAKKQMDKAKAAAEAAKAAEAPKAE